MIFTAGFSSYLTLHRIILLLNTHLTHPKCQECPTCCSNVISFTPHLSALLWGRYYYKPCFQIRNWWHERGYIPCSWEYTHWWADPGWASNPSSVAPLPAPQHHALLVWETAMSSRSLRREESLPLRKYENVVLPQFLQDGLSWEAKCCRLLQTAVSSSVISCLFQQDLLHLPGQSQRVPWTTVHVMPLISHWKQNCPASAIPRGC